MNFKSNPLSDLITALYGMNEILSKARHAFLEKEAEKKHFEALLTKTAEGKSHAEKSMNAQAKESWAAFHKDLARLESIYEFQRLKFSVLEKEYQANYIQIKLDADLMKKGES